MRCPPRPTLMVLSFTLLGLGLVGGCKHEQDAADLLQIGENHLLTLQWHSAIRPLRKCLLQDPNNAGAHYYLGRAYLNARSRRTLPPWRLTVALGELETALACFYAHGRQPALTRFTPDEFEVICYATMAQVHLRKLEFGVSLGMPLNALGTVLDDLEAATDAARAVMPQSDDVRHLDELIGQIRSFDPEAPTPGAAGADAEVSFQLSGDARDPSLRSG